MYLFWCILYVAFTYQFIPQKIEIKKCEKHQMQSTPRLRGIRCDGDELCTKIVT